MEQSLHLIGYEKQNWGQKIYAYDNNMIAKTRPMVAWVEAREIKKERKSALITRKLYQFW